MVSIRYIARIMSFGLKTIKLFQNWYSLLPYLQKTVSKDFLIKMNNGLKFYSNGDIADLVVLVEIFDNESNYDYFIKNNPLNVKKIIDIGGNIGAFSIYAATKYPNSVIYSFEPDKLNFEILQKNLSINKIKNVNFFNNAVGKSKEKILLYSQDDGNFGTANSSTIRKGPKSIEVQCISLMDIFQDNNIEQCDLLKLDCEGAEYDILFNAPTSIFEKIKTISIEYHNTSNYTDIDIVNFLKELHFDIVHIQTPRNQNFGYIYGKNLNLK